MAYTWGADGLVSQHHFPSGETHYYHGGPQQEVRQLTDDTGAVSSNYTYTAYGVPVASSGTDFNPHRYGGRVGYYSEGEFGLVLATHRWYSPDLMRWMNRDPIEYAGGDNLYAYVRGNPVGFVDPDGLQTAATWGTIGGGAGGTTTAGIGGTAGAAIVGIALIYCQFDDEGCAAAVETYCTGRSLSGLHGPLNIRAPGMPGPKDRPKRGPGSDGKPVKNPHGRGKGWIDDKGFIWTPSGVDGHGGKHWDVVDKNGGHRNIYPGGRERKNRR